MEGCATDSYLFGEVLVEDVTGSIPNHFKVKLLVSLAKQHCSNLLLS